MQMMQKQMTLLQNLITTQMTTSPESKSIQSESHSAKTTVTQTTHHDHNTRSKQTDIPSTPCQTPPVLLRLTQPIDTLTRTPIDLFTQPAAPDQPPEQDDALMQEQRPTA